MKPIFGVEFHPCLSEAKTVRNPGKAKLRSNESLALVCPDRCSRRGAVTPFSPQPRKESPASTLRAAFQAVSVAPLHSSRTATQWLGLLFFPLKQVSTWGTESFFLQSLPRNAGGVKKGRWSDCCLVLGSPAMAATNLKPLKAIMASRLSVLIRSPDLVGVRDGAMT